MKLFQFSTIVAVLMCSISVFAQAPAHYVIQLGSSLDNGSDLTKLSDIGNVYFEPSADGIDQDVILGTFKDLQKAEAITKNMRAKDFPNAYVAPLPIIKGKNVYVIQLANFNYDAQIDWSRYQLNKKVYTTIEPGKFKIVTGIFPSYDAALPLQNELYQIGFTNAEVVRVNSIFLHEVNKADIAFQEKMHDRQIGDVSEFTAKGGPSMMTSDVSPTEKTSELTPPLVGRVALSKSIAPAIHEDIARLSVKKLQSILAVYGNYSEEPNGIYDAKTANSYYATVQLTPSLKDFSARVEAKSNITSGYFTDWADVRLLLNISEFMTNRKIDFSDAELKALVSLYTKPKALSVADAMKVKDWKIKTISQLQNWKSSGKISAETFQAYSLISAKVEVLLEDFYLNKGFMIAEASDLAKATMFAMLVGNYDTI